MYVILEVLVRVAVTEDVIETVIEAEAVMLVLDVCDIDGENDDEIVEDIEDEEDMVTLGEIDVDGENDDEIVEEIVKLGLMLGLEVKLGVKLKLGLKLELTVLEDVSEADTLGLILDEILGVEDGLILWEELIEGDELTLEDLVMLLVTLWLLVVDLVILGLLDTLRVLKGDRVIVLVIE